jgi:TonB-dependent receptor
MNSTLRVNMLSASIACALLVGTSLPVAAAEPAGSPSAQTASGDAAAPQATPSSGAAQSATPASKPATLQQINVVGVRASQMQAIQLKRNAASIQDSITSEGIGDLPDITIADSLARITGVQVDQNAGEATTINIRGLPEVSTTINGEAFITPDNVYSIQPNYETLPSSLFSGADVIKSPTANMLTSGISGTVNLRTLKPWDLPFGWTFAGTAQAERGSDAGETKPNVNAFASYNDKGKWGVSVGLSYSNLVHSSPSSGFSAGGNGQIAGENAGSADTDSGYLDGWSGFTIPSQVKAFPDGSVDVNGDGKSNGAFITSQAFHALNEITQPKRIGANASFQADLGNGFTISAEGFLLKEKEYQYTEGLGTLAVTQNSPVQLPVAARDTGVVLHDPFNTPGVQTDDWNQNLYTTQAYNIWYGDLTGNTTTFLTKSIARNYNVKLNYDNGGPFTGDVRFINATASQHQDDMRMQTTTSDGSGWPNILMPGVSLPPTVYPYTGGTTAFNPNGFAPYTFATLVDYAGNTPIVTNPPNVTAALGNVNTWRLKGHYGDGYNDHTGMNIVRADGKYQFSDQFAVEFGLRNSIRSAYDNVYMPSTYVYAGNGGGPNGCLVRYTTSDVVVNPQGPGSCSAGNQYGYFRGNEYFGPLNQLPDPIGSNIVQVNNPAGVDGVSVYTVDPGSMRNAFAYEQQVAGGPIEKPIEPGASWNVLLKERTAYAQADFNGQLAGFDFSGNFGVRIVRTNLGVTQFVSGETPPQNLPPVVAGTIGTNRRYTDILPALNIAINLTPNTILRFAESKNMMPLSLDQWGGGFSPNYDFTTLPNGKPVEAIVGGSSSGNPDLNPWRSTNLGISAEHYFSNSSMISVALFRISVASFILESGVTNCSLPDADGVVRNRCVTIAEPVQGTGQSLHGAEFDYRQALTFLPGVLSHTGFEANATVSPSGTGTQDLAGRSVPFPNNSKYSGNLILWYQDSKLQARVGVNYRSKEAVESNALGVFGLEEYEAPQTYLDASVSYQVMPHVQVFLQGQNLTNESQRFYYVWPDQKLDANLSERYVSLGVRAQF